MMEVSTGGKVDIDNEENKVSKEDVNLWIKARAIK